MTEKCEVSKVCVATLQEVNKKSKLFILYYYIDIVVVYKMLEVASK
jgi:hypothetical protein